VAGGNLTPHLRQDLPKARPVFLKASVQRSRTQVQPRSDLLKTWFSVTEIPPPELRRRVGMVTQTAFLFPGTIADNLRFGPLQQGIELAAEPMEALLSQVGLGGRAGEGVAHLSGGEAQRVSLARALTTKPAVLLLDEPTSALDAKAKDEVERLILTVVKRNDLTCVMVSHDLAQAARVADQVMVMNQGRLTKIGKVSEVINAEGNLR
jgi:putative ABC transport system ATP-binding protein